jgi:hypothetical protein
VSRSDAFPCVRRISSTSLFCLAIGAGAIIWPLFAASQ